MMVFLSKGVHSKRCRGDAFATRDKADRLDHRPVGRLHPTFAVYYLNFAELPVTSVRKFNPDKHLTDYLVASCGPSYLVTEIACKCYATHAMSGGSSFS